jgi:hypothetical protein
VSGGEPLLEKALAPPDAVDIDEFEVEAIGEGARSDLGLGENSDDVLQTGKE